MVVPISTQLFLYSPLTIHLSHKWSVLQFSWRVNHLRQTMKLDVEGVDSGLLAKYFFSAFYPVISDDVLIHSVFSVSLRRRR